MEFSVRQVREDDADVTAALFNSVIEEGKYTALVEPFSVDKQRAFILELLESGVYNVAVAGDDRTLLGMQVVLPLSEILSFRHVGDIGTYVSPSSHRSGVGRALSEATFTAAREKGFSKIMAMIRGDNPRAQAFYKSIGFDYIGTAKKQALVRGEYIDEVLMERFL